MCAISIFDLICQNTEIMSLWNVFGRNSKTIFKLLRNFSSQIQSWCNKMFTDLEYENSTYSGVSFGNLSKSLSWRHYFWVLSDKIESTDHEYCPRYQFYYITPLYTKIHRTKHRWQIWEMISLKQKRHCYIFKSNLKRGSTSKKG